MFLLLDVFLRLYYILDIYQMSHYNIKDYFSYFINNFFYYRLIPILSFIILYLYNDNLLIKVICLIIIILSEITHYFIKPKLKFTKRIIRLLVISLFYSIIIYVIPYINYLNLIFEIILIPLLILENKISNKINHKYIIQAKNKLSNFKNKVIAITGSFGKTTTKNILSTLLETYDNTTKTPCSYNTLIGIAKYINSINLNFYNNIILEFGASNVGDIKELASYYRYDVAIVTEVGFMHLKTFKNIDNIINEKMELIKHSSIAFVNYENKYIREYDKGNANVVSYGINYGDYRALNINKNEFDLYYKNNFIIHIKHNMIGYHNILNVTCCLSYLHYFNYDLVKAKRTLLTILSTQNRLEEKVFKNNIILDDSFNSNLNGFKSALIKLKEYDNLKVLITPGIVELAEYESIILDELISYIVSSCDIVILVGVNKTRLLYYKLKEYNILIYLSYNFNEAYKIYKSITKGIKNTCLIENDLPEIYRKGIWF